MIDYKELKTIRWELGITQKQVANFLHVSQSYFSRMEKGLSPMAIEDFLRLVELYQVDLVHFIERIGVDL